jgi:4-amino-4-deoxy-L-arabinose transferase-like glycosyltransferase
MERSGKDGWKIDVVWLLAWGVLSSVWCVTAAGKLSATFDEPIYIARGLDHWRTGSHAGLLHLGTMPLPPDVQTLPLYLWERWQGVRFDPVADFGRLLPWARAGTLVFWWLLLAHAWLAGRHLAGPWAGRLAVALLACEPSLLAHAGLATTDLAITACLLALVYHFRANRDAGWPRRVGWPACWFAAAVLAKASGLVFGPICLLVVEAERLWRQRTQPSTQYSALIRDLVQICVLGLALAFVYCGTDGQPQPSFVEWAHSLPDGTFGRSMVWLSEHLCVFSNAGEGLMRQVKHNVHGHGVYLLGQTDPRSLWYYFPLVLTIKLSVPLLLLPAVVAVVRPRALANWAALAALALLAFSVTCRVQIGVRLILPLVGLAVVGVAAGVVTACRELGPGWRSRLLAGGVGAGLTWTIAAAATVWPEGLCYVNDLWGGTREGYVVVSDANYDWGQGLKELARWQRRHPQAPLDVWYFGSDPRLARLPIRPLSLEVLPIQGPDDVLSRVRGHYLAASTTFLHGMVVDTPERQRTSEFLLTRRPVARTPTFVIYDFTQETGPR